MQEWKALWRTNRQPAVLARDMKTIKADWGGGGPNHSHQARGPYLDLEQSLKVAPRGMFWLCQPAKLLGSANFQLENDLAIYQRLDLALVAKSATKYIIDLFFQHSSVLAELVGGTYLIWDSQPHRKFRETRGKVSKVEVCLCSFCLSRFTILGNWKLPPTPSLRGRECKELLFAFA